MKAVIQRTNDFKNYIVITNNGREFIVKNIGYFNKKRVKSE
ncbi:hypothetical protein [Aliarcobacter cryaerophilus]|jgi:hypothetical protein|nr:hypothetical protein [Aliarcobacter cryaerophilus]MCT7513710.1 hypothetical protein [Aliarcobacter cryaerophilus]